MTMWLGLCSGESWCDGGGGESGTIFFGGSDEVCFRVFLAAGSDEADLPRPDCSVSEHSD